MKNEEQKLPLVFEYMDYRKFLTDLFGVKKKLNPLFSYRSFNHAAGIRSSAFLKLVMDGKRNLAEEGIRKIIKGFQMDEREGRYFTALVYFTQSESLDEKNNFFQIMMEEKGIHDPKNLTPLQYHLLARWYYVAILELVCLTKPVQKNMTWLCEKLSPLVEKREINTAVHELIRLGLLVKDSNGFFARNNGSLSTPDEVASLSVFQFHKQMSGLAGKMIDFLPPDLREYTSYTTALSLESMQKIKEEMRGFRKKIRKIVEADPHPKVLVGHLNLHLFALNFSTLNKKGSNL